MGLGARREPGEDFLNEIRMGSWYKGRRNLDVGQDYTEAGTRAGLSSSPPLSNPEAGIAGRR